MERRKPKTPDPWPLERRLDTTRGTVRYGVFGDGPPLVLVHGTPSSSHAWHRLVPDLVRHRRVYLYDLLGYGRSEKRPGQDVSLGVQNVVLAELVRHWGLDAPGVVAPDVVAHDFGGATALRAHLLDGVAYGRLVLLDAVSLSPWGSPFVRHVREHERAFAGMPAGIHEAVVAAYLRDAFHRPMSGADLQPFIAPWLGPEGQAAFYRQIAQMDERFTREVEDRYGEIRVPTLILWGEEDAWLPLETGLRLQERIPGARLERIPDAGHFVQVDAPEAVLEHVRGFLGIRTGDGTPAR